jgi:hypothetical protein
MAAPPLPLGWASGNVRAQPPHCDADGGTCGSWVAIPYLCSFYVLVALVMLNLFTAVIVESFEEQQHTVSGWCACVRGLKGCGDRLVRHIEKGCQED